MASSAFSLRVATEYIVCCDMLVHCQHALDSEVNKAIVCCFATHGESLALHGVVKTNLENA